MRAFRFEYRFRFVLHAVIYLLGFWAPWRNALPFDHFHSLWEFAATRTAETGLLGFQASFIAVLVLSIAFLLLGAFFRVWGAAYVGASVVRSRFMHGETMLADGPYRRTRNPLYLGTLLHTFGIAFLMPVSGAVLCVALIWVLQFRLALAEEPFLAERFGAPYLEYKARVPRFLPPLTPLAPSAGQHPRWLQAVLGEFYFVAVPVVMLVWGWQFNALDLKRGILISLGAWMVIYALLPRAKTEAAAA